MAYTENKTVAGLDAKATPIDADVVVTGDSADSNRAKQTTFAQLRTWVEAFTSYFNVSSDTLDDITDGVTYVKSTNDYDAAAVSKLAGIEASADVTDATNVNAAGATMNTDTTMVGNSYFLDEDTLSSDDATKVASQQSIKAYVDSLTGDISVSLTKASQTATTTNAWETFTFTTEEYDTDTMHDNVSNTSRITFTTAGKYSISGSSEAVLAKTFGLRILKNGTTSMGVSSGGAAFGLNILEGGSISIQAEFSAGDYIELQFASNNPGCDPTTIRFAAHKIV